MNDTDKPRNVESYNPLDRAQAVSRSLADAARRARFSARARGAYQNPSPEAQRAARLMRVIRLTLLVLIVAIPNLVCAAYIGLIAANQYVSEAKFTVSSGAIPKLDGLGSVTGLPQMMMVQNSLILVNFISSRDMVGKLEKSVDLRRLYGAEKGDFWTRFSKDKPIEKFTRYWEKMAKPNVAFPSGIVTLEVRAFTAQDAKRIADHVILECETLVNKLNERMYRETVSASMQTLAEAAEQLKASRIAYQEARNAEGILDVRQTGSALSQLQTELKGQLLKIQADYRSRIGYQNEASQQMRLLKAHMTALEKQINAIESQITEESGGDRNNALSDKLGKFANLELEQKISETRYASAAGALDAARLMTERKMIYLHTVVAPALAEEAEYPKRALTFGLFFLGSLLAWGLAMGLVGFIRNHMS